MPHTFTSGYFVSIVDFNSGKFLPSKSMRYKCFAPVFRSELFRNYFLRVMITFMSKPNGGCSSARQDLLPGRWKAQPSHSPNTLQWTSTCDDANFILQLAWTNSAPKLRLNLFDPCYRLCILLFWGIVLCLYFLVIVGSSHSTKGWEIGRKDEMRPGCPSAV